MVLYKYSMAGLTSGMVSRISCGIGTQQGTEGIGMYFEFSILLHQKVGNEIGMVEGNQLPDFCRFVVRLTEFSLTESEQNELGQVRPVEARGTHAPAQHLGEQHIGSSIFDGLGNYPEIRSSTCEQKVHTFGLSPRCAGPAFQESTRIQIICAYRGVTLGCD